jgi:hypothetical protein
MYIILGIILIILLCFLNSRRAGFREGLKTTSECISGMRWGHSGESDYYNPCHHQPQHGRSCGSIGITTMDGCLNKCMAASQGYKAVNFKPGSSGYCQCRVGTGRRPGNHPGWQGCKIIDAPEPAPAAVVAAPAPVVAAPVVAAPVVAGMIDDSGFSLAAIGKTCEEDDKTQITTQETCKQAAVALKASGVMPGYMQGEEAAGGGVTNMDSAGFLKGCSTSTYDAAYLQGSYQVGRLYWNTHPTGGIGVGGVGGVNCGRPGCAHPAICGTARAAKIPIKGCENQRDYGQYCFKCNDGYKITDDKKYCKKIEDGPLENCAKEKDDGGNCIACFPGYQIKEDGAKCELVKIPYCKKQINEYCEECNEGYEQKNEGKGCGPIPKSQIKHCTRQREWGTHCYACGNEISGYKPSWDNKKCNPIKITSCADQVDNICKTCEPGYIPSENKRRCDLITIKNCDEQDGPKCKMCKLGYRLGANRRKCDILPIANCSKRG